MRKELKETIFFMLGVLALISLGAWGFYVLIVNFWINPSIHSDNNIDERALKTCQDLGGEIVGTIDQCRYEWEEDQELGLIYCKVYKKCEIYENK